MKNNAFTRFLRKMDMRPGDFARETGISLNTVKWWCYHNYNPRHATFALARRAYPDLPLPRKMK